MLRKKRGQVTLIVILAILIFFIMILLLGARARMVKAQMNLAATKQIHDYVDQTAIKQYVTSCLNSVSEEIMVKAAMQAGVLDFSGMTKDKDYVEYYDPIYNRTFNVSIIIPDNYQCSIIRHTPSAYPFENLSLSLLEGKYAAICGGNRQGYFASYSGFFGLNNYTRLCAWNGSNRPGVTSSGFSAYTCMDGTYNYLSTIRRVPTFQERMQEEISQRMKECVNTTFLQERYPANISMISEPETVITFGERSITMITTYPFLLEVEKKEPIQRMINFSVTRDIPFKNMYNYVFNLIKKDVSEYNYDKFNGSGQVAVYDYYVVNRTTQENTDPINPANKILIDIIQVFDNQTNIQSNPLIFSYAVINRRPALDYIHVDSSNEYDVVALENSTLRLSPIGYDPDEDGIVYNYSLWWEDYHETYDFMKPACLSVTSIQDMINSGCMINSSYYYPRNWTNSTKFQSTGREAEKYIQKSDTGFHIVNISVWDRELLRDWQEVRILVTDMPVARVNASNFYEDIVPENVTSYEDPYLLDGSGSTVGWGQLNVFIWNDTSYHEFEVTKYVASQGKLLLIPNETGTSVLVNEDHSIADIAPNKNDGDSFVFRRPPKPNVRFNGSIYNITLTAIASAPSGRQNTKLFSVNVTQCLPHINNTDPAYPYNKEPENYWSAFYANHTCCTQFNYRGNDAECFYNRSYGANWSFEDFWTKGDPLIYPQNYKDSPNKPPIVYIPGPPEIGTTDNDIYMMTFKRNCSGYRGNICSGNASEERENVETCIDITDTNPSLYDERCSGPPRGSPGENGWLNSPTSPGCVNYTATNTFELYATALAQNGGTTDGRCTINREPAKRSSNNNDIVFDSAGIFQCYGLCDENGGCTYTTDADCICNQRLSGNTICTSPAYKSLSTCDAAGKPGLPDVCEDCILKDKQQTCRKSAQCPLDRECWDIIPGKQAGTYNGICNDSCRYVPCPGSVKYDIQNQQCFNTCLDQWIPQDNRCISGTCQPDGSCQ